MNRLTINRVALGSIRRRRGQYKAVIIGAGLAIFFVSSLFWAVQSVLETYRLAHVQRKGSQDVILRDCDRPLEDLEKTAVNPTPEALLESGLVACVGSMYIIGETNGTGCPIGYYDEQGMRMASRILTEGRLPIAAGEIAAEPNFLQRLRFEAEIGSVIELPMNIPRGRRAEFLPDPVTKAFTLVGILKPQSMYLQGTMKSDYDYYNWPSAIVSDKERVEAGGRAIVHRMINLAPGVSFDAFNDFAGNAYDIGHNALFTQYAPFSLRQYSREDTEGQITLMIAGILGLVLILSACLGIANAFSASLSQRRTQIGMMRAVGATSRQIRTIFGREALMLAALIAPAAIALSYAFVWLLTRLIDALVFNQNPLFLPIVLLASLACVALAAFIPLIGASKLPPMQAIREVSLMRARKKIRLRGKAEYSAPRLIAKRYLCLYKTRQVGIALLVALSMLMIAMGVPFVVSTRNDIDTYPYEIASFRWSENDFVETYVNAQAGLIDADAAEVLSLPLVSRVDTASQLNVNFIVDEVTPYGIYARDSGYWSSPNNDAVVAYNQFRDHFKIDKQVYPSTLYAVDEHFLRALEAYVIDGNFDIDAINSGLEVVVLAEEKYYLYENLDEMGRPLTRTISPTPVKGRNNERMFTNDMFHAGDDLSILRLFTRGGITYLDGGDPNYESGVFREDAQAKIGAVLGLDGIYALNDLQLWFANTGTIVTTHQGLKSLGLEPAGYANLSVRLSGAPDDATHKYLSSALKSIAARGTDMEFMDNIQSVIDSTFWQNVFILCLLAVALLLMSMCVSLVNNAVTVRIRSDKRAIGTLRAVGAPFSDIVSTYRLQVLVMLVVGVVLGVLLSGVFFLWQYLKNYLPYYHAFDMPLGLVALVQSLFLAAVALCCGINLSLRIREITRDSIVANIREL